MARFGSDVPWPCELHGCTAQIFAGWATGPSAITWLCREHYRDVVRFSATMDEELAALTGPPAR